MDNMNNQESLNKVSKSTTKIPRPLFNLKDSINMTKKIYDDNSRNYIDETVIAQTLNHTSSSSGAFGRKITTLLQYGLIEKIQEKQYKVSEKYIHYITELVTENKSQYLETFLNNPTLFKEIKTWFNDLNTINEQLIISNMIRKRNANKEVANDTAKIFCESLNFVKENKCFKPIEKKSSDENSQQFEISNTLDSSILPKNITDNEFIFPLNGKKIIIHLPDSIINLTNEDMEEIIDALQFVEKKLNKQKDKNNKDNNQL